MASALQLLGAAFCHRSSRPKGASKVKWAGRKKEEWDFFLKASVNVNVFHFSPKVCHSDQSSWNPLRPRNVVNTHQKDRYTPVASATAPNTWGPVTHLAQQEAQENTHGISSLINEYRSVFLLWPKLKWIMIQGHQNFSSMTRIFRPCPSSSTIRGQSAFLQCCSPLLLCNLPPKWWVSLLTSEMCKPPALLRAPWDSSHHCPRYGPTLDMKWNVHGFCRDRGFKENIGPFPKPDEVREISSCHSNGV